MNSSAVAVSAKPRVRCAPRSVTSDGEDAVLFAADYGLVADLWQADVVTDWLGRTPNGDLAAVLCGLCVGRQNGKNGAIEIRELFGMVELGEKFLHTAHEVKTARKAFKRLKYFFGEKANDPNCRYPELNALVAEVRNTNGQEAIVLTNGGSVEFIARSKGSGRGYTVDVLVLDEAQQLTEAELEALLSTISAAESPPQMIITGTSPNPDKGETAEVFTRVRNLQGKNDSFAWTDFGVTDGPLPDIDDPRITAATNPALGTRLHQSVLDLERLLLSPEGYARERLGWWGDPKTESPGVMNIKKWAKLSRPNAKPPARAVLAIDVSPNRMSASLAAAGKGKGDKTIVITQTKPFTTWVADAVDKVLRKRDVAEVCLFPGGQAGPLIPELTKVLTKYGMELTLLSSRDMGQACAGWQNALRGGSLEHVGQTELDAAVANAKTKYSGEAELWYRKDPTIDISPLVAGSEAVFRWANQDDYDVEDSYL